VTIKFYPTHTAYFEIEDRVHDMYTGLDEKVHVVAVEIFNHPEAYHAANPEQSRGKWAVGPLNEIEELMQRREYNYEVQYELQPHDNEEDE